MPSTEVTMETLLMLHTMPCQPSVVLTFVEKLHMLLSISKDAKEAVNISSRKCEIQV